MHKAVLAPLLVFVLAIPSIKCELSFEHQVLRAHNNYRRKHGCQALALSAPLSQGCFDFARDLANQDKLYYSGVSFGENICVRTDDDPVRCVQQWYDEGKNYDYDKAEFSEKTKQFTQLIWNSTELLGVAQARGTSGKIFVVARYRPAGNVKGEFRHNVPKSSDKNGCAHRYVNLLLILFCLTISIEIFNEKTPNV